MVYLLCPLFLGCLLLICFKLIYHPLIQIHHKITGDQEIDLGQIAPFLPPQLGTNPGQQNLDGKGLRHIVICSAVQPPDNVLVLIQTGHDNDGSPVHLPDTSAQFKSIAVRQTDIQQTDIDIFLCNPFQRLPTVAGKRHLIIFLSEYFFQFRRQNRIIFHNQYGFLHPS